MANSNLDRVLENIRVTSDGTVVLVKKPKDMNVTTLNVSLSFGEYEYLVSQGIDRIEVLSQGRKSKRVEWDSRLLKFAQFRGTYYLVPYSVRSKMVVMKELNNEKAV